jgi:hypothetical protein
MKPPLSQQIDSDTPGKAVRALIHKRENDMLLKVVVALLSLCTLGGGVIWTQEDKKVEGNSEATSENTKEINRLSRKAAEFEAQIKAMEHLLYDMQTDLKILLQRVR